MQESYDGGALVVVPDIRMKQSKRDPLGYNVESIVQLLQCCLGRYKFSPKLNGIIDSHQHV